MFVFTFNDINLPWEGMGRYGYVQYSIPLNPNLAEGTRIENTAGIVFDYNVPVITNTVVNTIDNQNLIYDPVSSASQIYPNPANQSFSIAVNSVESVRITNLSGQLVRQFSAQASYFIGDLPKQVYIVSMITRDGVFVQKLIKE